MSIEIPQQRFVDAFGSTMSGGEEMERSSVRENFSELQVALFGEHIFAAWDGVKILSFHFFTRRLLNFVSLVLVIDEGLGFLHHLAHAVKSLISVCLSNLPYLISLYLMRHLEWMGYITD